MDDRRYISRFNAYQSHRRQSQELANELVLENKLRLRIYDPVMDQETVRVLGTGSARSVPYFRELLWGDDE